MKFAEVWVQNQILWVLRGPWRARAGNLDIPIGILRFLSLPGALRSLQTGEKHKISIEIIFLHSKTGFSPGILRFRDGLRMAENTKYHDFQ